MVLKSRTKTRYFHISKRGEKYACVSKMVLLTKIHAEAATQYSSKVELPKI
jgi:hypothetical protein